MRRALFSVTDKTGLVEFARGLARLGFEIVSTGGTSTALREAGVDVTDVSTVTGFPELMGGRLKTLHPLVHGGLLGRPGLDDEDMAAHGILKWDILCVNLYKFEEAWREGLREEALWERIDIGGPAMIRAAAKNHAHVLPVVDPGDYPLVLEAWERGDVDHLRRPLAAKAFRHTALYDSIIARTLGDGEWPESFPWGLRRRVSLRYGENPHQSGALYVDPLQAGGIANYIQLWGKELSYNNLLDADVAWQLAGRLPPGSCVIVKHGNPCGAACGADLSESVALAREGDPVSAYGGIVAVNATLDEAAARALAEKGNFFEVVIAPAFVDGALDVLRNRAGWGRDVRLLTAERVSGVALEGRSIEGGLLLQERDPVHTPELRAVTRRDLTAEEVETALFLWPIAAAVKSNAIVVGSGRRLLGVGAGQMNRVQSVRLALEAAGDATRGAVLVSDAFFPFPDSVERAAEAGIAAIVQPGGSKKDHQVIEAADRAGLAMAFTGSRHFRH